MITMLNRRIKCAVLSAALLSGLAGAAQRVTFTEYNLPNGLHVILHQDKSAPVVTVSVMYHVGSKNEDTARTGFAHFFEHLLFEGTDNIARGKFFRIVSANGGQNNANTTYDRTFYYEEFPSNQLELGLWLESERMMHPVINQIGVQTQREVVREERRQRMDNTPYGNLVNVILGDLFTDHPYHRSLIGSMEHLGAARLEEFQAFFKKFYVPNNAVLSIAGDIDPVTARKLVTEYFGAIPRGPEVVQHKITDRPITHQIVDTAYDANIQLPALVAAYRVPGMNSKDARALEMISTVLSGGASSRLSRKMRDEKKEALAVQAVNLSLEDYGAYITFALPNNNTPLDTLLKDIDEEVARLQRDLISESEYNKIINQFDNNYVTANSTSLGVAENLANGYTFFNKNTDHVNEVPAQTHAVTREAIREAARKYLQKDQRVVVYYLPAKK